MKKILALKMLKSIEFGRVLHAMHQHRNKITGGNRALFEIVYKKVFNQGKDAVLESWEVELICLALRNRAKFLKQKNKVSESYVFYELYEQMTSIRVMLQEIYGPKINKAASAGTLTAVAQ